MTGNRRSSFYALSSLGVQAIAGVIALAALAFTPSTQGRLLLVPLTPGASAALPRAVTHLQARLIGLGPLPGSMIVDAHGASLFAAMLRHGTLALAAPSALCGETLDGRSGT